MIPTFLMYNITLTVTTPELLEKVDNLAKEMNIKPTIHLKIDTGMGRMGIQYFEAEKLLEKAAECKNCYFEGVFSHFAAADDSDLTFTQLQLSRFNQVVQQIKKIQETIPNFCKIIHIANSGAIHQLPDAYFSMVRAGISLYGYHPNSKLERQVDVNPALNFISKIVQIKQVSEGATISYGMNWKASKTTRIATIPVGYGDGYLRYLHHKGTYVKVKGKKYFVVGNVCMDQIMVDIGLEEDIQCGDDVYLIDAREDVKTVDKDIKLDADNLADWGQTISYEILTNISARVPRVYLM